MEAQPLNRFDNTTLLQMYANADETFGNCLGHYKGNMNELLRGQYAFELRRRGIIVPAHADESVQANVSIPKGIFNGKGAY